MCFIGREFNICVTPSSFQWCSDHSHLMTACPFWIPLHTLWIWQRGKHSPAQEKQGKITLNLIKSFKSLLLALSLLPLNLCWWFYHRCQWSPWRGWQWFQTTWTKSSAGCQTWRKSCNETKKWGCWKETLPRFACRYSVHVHVITMRDPSGRDRTQ